MPKLYIEIDLDDCVPQGTTAPEQVAAMTKTVATVLRVYARGISGCENIDSLDEYLYRKAKTKTGVLRAGEARVEK